MNNKIKFTREEMELMFQERFPYLEPNYTNVGLFAKRNGYQKVRQTVKGKQIYFYVRKEDVR